MLIGNQFDSYTLWRPATRSDPVAIQSIPGEVPGASAADALPPKLVSWLLRSLVQSGAKMEQVEIERA